LSILVIYSTGISYPKLAALVKISKTALKAMVARTRKILLEVDVIT